MVRIRVNFKIVVLSVMVTILMYPGAVEALISSAKNIYIAGKLNTAVVPTNSTKADEAKTDIVFIFDDGWSSVYTEAYGVMNKYGNKGSVAIIPSLVGEDEYMSYEQLSELYLQGWDMLNHSYSHQESMYDVPNELLIDFNRARQWMKNRYIGKSNDMAVMPYGEVNPYLIGRFKDARYRNVRTSDNIIILDNAKVEYYPIATINLLTSVSVDEVTDILIQTSNQKKTFVFILHKIGNRDNGSGMTYHKDKFEQIIRFINEHGDIFNIITYSEMF